MRKVTLPLKYRPPPPVKDTGQRGEHRGKILTSSNACLTQENEKSERTEASHRLQGQGGPSFTPKRSTYKQNCMYPLSPPRRYAQVQQRLRAQVVHEARNCQAQITLTTVVSGIPQQQVPNSIQSGNPFQGSSLGGQPLYAAPLPASTKSKTRDGMYAKSLRSLRKGSDGAGDDDHKFFPPQRKNKNKKTISDNDSKLRYASDADLNDKNVNLLPSNANYHDSDLLSLCPAKDVDDELLTGCCSEEITWLQCF